MTHETIGFKTTRDGTLIVHPDIRGTVDNINIPQVDTIYGAGFGDYINDQDRALAASREPIGYFLTYLVASDMIDKWFTIEDPDTEEADPALDRACQQNFSRLYFRKYLRKAVESARVYGRSLLVGAFNDAKSVGDLAKPKASNAQLMQLAVYPETYHQWKVKEFTVDTVDLNPVSSRYGQPLTYMLMRQNLNESGQSVSDNIIVHYTRVCEVGDGTSVLDKVWDDMTCGRNIRWGAAQWMYRTGSGYPVFSFPAGTTAAQLQAAAESGLASNLMAKTSILIAQNSVQENTGMTFEFKGAAGSAIDPTPFYVQNIQQIAIATGYPQAKLIGAQAGAVTGSEVNQQEYYKAISRDQIAYCEEPIRWVIKCLIDAGQLTLIKAAVDKLQPNYKLNLFKATIKRLVKRDYRHKTAEQYEIVWNSAFELSELDETQIRLNKASAYEKELGWKSKDEVRAEEGLDPLPDGAGEWKDQPDLGFGEEEFVVKTKQGMKPNAKPKDDETATNNQNSASGAASGRT